MSISSINHASSILTNSLKAGGTELIEKKDYGFMQQRTIADFDGHSWDIFYMDISKLPTENHHNNNNNSIIS